GVELVEVLRVFGRTAPVRAQEPLQRVATAGNGLWTGEHDALLPGRLVAAPRQQVTCRHQLIDSTGGNDRRVDLTRLERGRDVGQRLQRHELDALQIHPVFLRQQRNVI